MTVDRVHLSRWWAAAVVSDVERLRTELEVLVAGHAKPVGILLVVQSRTPLSPDASRKAAAKMLREFGRSVGAVAIVIEGDGFFAAAIRAMFNGIALLIRPRFSWKIFGQETDAAHWLADGGFAPRDELLGAARELGRSFAV